jgi:hypothetical protein
MRRKEKVGGDDGERERDGRGPVIKEASNTSPQFLFERCELKKEEKEQLNEVISLCFLSVPS